MWFYLAIGAAFFQSLRYLLGKQLGKYTEFHVILWSQWFFGLIILIPLMILSPFTSIDSKFWILIVLNGFIALLANSLFWIGIKKSDISLAIPLTSFTPLFSLLFSPVLIQQLPSRQGFAGIIITVMGTYLLNFRKSIKEIFYPFAQLWRDQGLRLVFGASIIWGLTSVIDKIAINLSSPIFYLASSYAINAFLAFCFFSLSGRKINILKTNKNLVGMGLTLGIGHVLQMYAINIYQVSYVVAVMNSGILFSVIWGFLFLNEKDFWKRLVGALIMIGGVLVILFYG